jgi:hypothetical protein
MTKILARRLIEKVTESKIIGEVQRIGKIGEGSYFEAKILHNIIEDTNQYRQKVNIGYIDLSKVYDMVETWVLEKVLEKMGLSKDFRELIMNINTDTRVSVITDFGITRKFVATKGIRQGYPLSLILFCLFLTPWIGEEKGGY